MSTQTRRVAFHRDPGTSQVMNEEEVADLAQDSIELSLNAKGEPSWCIKAYGKTAVEVEERLAALRGVVEKQAAQARASRGASA